MPIKLIVEDGSMPAGANSYADLATAEAYAAGRGPAVPALAAWAEAGAGARSAALIRAADVLNAYHWKGVSAAPDRIMAWPRRCAGRAGLSPFVDFLAEGSVIREALAAPVEIVVPGSEESGSQDGSQSGLQVSSGGLIPPQLVAAQCELAAAILAEGDPLAPVDPYLGPITSAKVDTLAMSYAAPAASARSAAHPAAHPAVAALLRELLLEDPYAQSGVGGNGSGRSSLGQTEIGRG